MKISGNGSVAKNSTIAMISEAGARRRAGEVVLRCSIMMCKLLHAVLKDNSRLTAPA
jgi:hypothetical protein